jgi:hypothetical protein
MLEINQDYSEWLDHSGAYFDALVKVTDNSLNLEVGNLVKTRGTGGVAELVACLPTYGSESQRFAL